MSIPRVLGAVGAKCLHLNVLSMNSSLSFASEYLSRSSTFWPDVPRNLEAVWDHVQRIMHLATKTIILRIDYLPDIIKLKTMRICTRSESIICWRPREKASMQWLKVITLVTKENSTC